ncbi:RNA polymerase sigma-70 factor [Chitinophaga sp. MM2321]|uniref:RNA polymerase sigma factor n=1 Tax=Chitinophaga sp. MM2321 TaxID=3137178 RepID=UPI0032D5AB1E
MYHVLTDKELLTAYNNGDATAFKEIYDRYWGLLFNHARRMLKDQDLASDAVQDVFMMLLSKSRQVDQVKSVPGFLYGCMRNRIINDMAHEKVKDNYVRFLQHYSLNDFTNIEEEIFETREDIERELHERIEAEISLLPPKMRAAFELAKKEHLSYKEIAIKTGTSEGTVKKHIYTALRILRNKLNILLPGSFFL